MRTTRRWKPSAGALAAVLFTSGAYGAHPLNTEDTGTQGKGGWQLEVNGERNQDKVAGEAVKGAQAAALLSYGAGENVDLQFGVPWQDNGEARGAGDLIAAIKWKFWEQGPLSGGIRAAVTAPHGDEDQGLGNGKPTLAAQLIGQYEGERWMFLAHAGYRRNSNTVGNRESISEISGAVLCKVTGRLKLLVDANRTTNADPASDQKIRQIVLGAIYSPSKDLDLDIGVRRGNDAAIDRAVMAGFTLRW
ncbi:MAG TPA: transporter [Burkholderiales bacterium]|nr:transporter [Burkholderiales bacterium]